MIVPVKTKAEAIGWACRVPHEPGLTGEIRQLFEDADFALVDPTGARRA